MPKARLGVALLVPPPLATEIDGLRRALGDGALGRIPPHLTLVPPVNVREDRLPDALAVLRAAAASARPLALVLGPPATFLPDTPVLHLGVAGDGLGALAALRDAVFREPLARPLTWPWVPHVTLADEARPDRIAAAIAALADYRVDVTFERVHLMREGPGRVWERIADAPFGPPAVVGRGGLELELAPSEGVDPEAALLLDGPPPRAPGRSFTVTARRGGRVVGVAAGAAGAAGEEAAVLTGLVVAPADRRQGIGSHLLAAVTALAASRGCTALVADPAAMPVLEGFLRHRGWTADAAAPGPLRRVL